MINDAFFNPTPDQLEEAKNGGVPKLVNGEECTFLIDGVKQSEDSKGQPMVILNTKLVGGKHDGKEFPHFIRQNKFGLKFWFNILALHFPQERIDKSDGGNGVTPTDLVGLKFSSVAETSVSDGNEYTNFKKVISAEETIGGTAAPAGGEDIPF